MSKPPRKKKRKLSKPTPLAKRLEIAKFVVANPHKRVEQVAKQFDVTKIVVYNAIYDFVDVRKEYRLKASAEALEWPYDYEAPK